MTLALVVGGARCVWDDAVEVYRRATPDLVIVANDMIPRWPFPLDHAVTLHPQKLPGWLNARLAIGRDRPRVVWSHCREANVDRVTADWQGSSALLALKIALVELKADAAVLAGVPLDRSPHFIRSTGEWTDAHTFVAGWRARQKEVEPRTRSMSGWPRTMFGEPTPDWLASIGARPADPSKVAAILAAADNQAKAESL
jgi:hypothetical protein